MKYSFSGSDELELKSENGFRGGFKGEQLFFLCLNPAHVQSRRQFNIDKVNRQRREQYGKSDRNIDGRTEL